jgi:hypothetical protein
MGMATNVETPPPLSRRAYAVVILLPLLAFSTIFNYSTGPALMKLTLSIIKWDDTVEIAKNQTGSNNWAGLWDKDAQMAVQLVRNSDNTSTSLPYASISASSVDFNITGDPSQEFDAPFCVPWETNMDIWWTHHVDWGVKKENATHLCFSPLDEEEGSYLRQVYRSQYIDSCNNNNSLYKEMWSTGYGADISSIVDGVEYSRRNNISFNVIRRGPWLYATGECETQDIHCYFLPFASCWNRTDMAFKGNGFLCRPRIKHYEKPYKYILDYITRPMQSFRKEIYDYVEERAPKITGPAMCLHVRRTDVVLHGKISRRYHAIQEYMEAAQRKVPDRFHRNVLLFTDDEDAIDEAKLHYPQHNWIYLNRTRHRGAEGGFEGQVPSNSPRLEVIILHSIFRLMQHCDVYVFSTSNIAFIFGSHAPSNVEMINLDAGMRKMRVHKSGHAVGREANYRFVPPPPPNITATPVDRRWM